MKNKIVNNNAARRHGFVSGRKTLQRLALPAALLFASGTTYGAHPLITEDTGTQGTGKTQIEVTSEFGRERDGAHVDTTDLAVVLTRGITDTLDLALALPWQQVRERDSGASTTERGVGDTEIFAKWRFYEQGDLSFALKPSLTLATGDESRGLGAGRTGAALAFIASLQPAPWAFHVQAGWRWNNNKLDERDGLWHASTAVTRDIGPWKLLADIGIERNADPAASRDPAFALIGFIYAVREGLDLDLGYKVGLNDPETDHTVMAGITWRF